MSNPENCLLLRWLLGTVTMPTWLQPCIIVVSIHFIKFGGEMCPKLAFYLENCPLLRWLPGTVTLPTWLQPCIIVVSIHFIKFGGEMFP